MSNTYTNPCTRCGQERILSRTWKENLKTFSGTLQEVVYTEYVCPTSDCQVIVEKELTTQREKRESIQQKKEERAKENTAKRGGLKVPATK